MAPDKSKIKVKTVKLENSKSPALTSQTQQTPPIPRDEAGSQPRVLKHMQQPQPKKKILPQVIGAIVIVLAGIGSGFGLSRVTGTGLADLKSSSEIAEKGISVGDIVGIKDEKTFRDKAEGVLILGGVDGEGSHHLIRPGGPSQNVYVTSSVVDLDQFVDHKIKVWGETFAAQQAGWLMDVGRVEVRELNAEKPFEEE